MQTLKSSIPPASCSGRSSSRICNIQPILSTRNTHITHALSKDPPSGASGAASEQKLSALRQSLLHEYARQLDSKRSSRSSPASTNNRWGAPKTKAAAQQLQQTMTTHIDEDLEHAYHDDLPGQLLHRALNSIPPPSSKLIQQQLWTQTVTTHLPTASIDELPNTSELAVKLPPLPPLPSPTAASSTPPSPTLSSAEDTPADSRHALQPTAPNSPPEATAPGYDWINPRRKQLTKLALRDDLIPLAKHYGLDLFKTKAEAIQQLLEVEFSDFLQEREEALMQLPSREQLVPLARSYGIDPSGFKRDLVRAIIRHEFRRLTEARRQQLEACSAGDLMAQVRSCGIDLLGDKGLLVGRILVHEARLRAQYCSQLPSAKQAAPAEE